ncbi:MAG: 4a-hydroxytetrahydrobiopterin dehydratase [Candidatus Azotimanducaceae bacterium]|jgi:4a-hydroxytetrahydrobiopterin dehydratase
MWREQDHALCADIVFKDFIQAFAFMTLVAELAEEHQHHPDWSNVYNRVRIKLTTHDAGNQVTDKDRALAADIESHPGIKVLIDAADTTVHKG